jgi:outer membrane lipoprotein-sorting protein
MTALPPTLDRFGGALEHAVRRDVASRRRRRRAVKVAVLFAAACTVALGLLSVLPTRAPSVVERAAAALHASGDTILHIEFRAEQRNPDGSVVTWRSESWQLQTAPFTRRTIEVGHEGIRAEMLTTGETRQLYDARTNTIYVGPREEDGAREGPTRVGPGPEPGTVRVRTKFFQISPDGSVRTYTRVAVLTEEEAARMLERSDDARQQESASGPVEEPFRAEILALLQSGAARETGRVEVEGREAIRIESSNGRKTYLVDAATYAPLEWTTTGDGGGVTLRFPVYEELPVDAESMRLLDLTAQYPGAHVERDPDAYRAAEARLFPNG